MSTGSEMSVAEGSAGTADETAVVDDAAAGQCPVCPHPWARHDAIGRRYCTASQTASRPNGCVCVG